VYYVSGAGERGILRQADATGTRFLLRKNKFRFTPEEAVAIGPHEKIMYVTQSPVYTGKGPMKAEAFLREKNANLSGGIPFYGVEGPTGEDQVVLFELR